MDKYESVCILAQNCTNDDISNIMVKIQDKIGKFSKMPVSFENIGKKKLAYEIKNNKEGYYLVSQFEAEPSCISELERFYRINEKVLKFINVRRDD